jgi:hypothetical protein
MRNLESKLSRMEDRILREIGDVRDGLQKQIDSLESFVKNELKSLGDRLDSEQDKRSELARELKAYLRETNEALEKKAGQLDNRIEYQCKDLREQLLDQTKRLTEHMRDRHEAALRVMQESTEQIRNEYVDRANLSRLLTQLAVRLDSGLASGILSVPEEGDNE